MEFFELLEKIVALASHAIGFYNLVRKSFFPKKVKPKA